MTLEQLREQFLVDDDVPNEKLEQLIQKALPYCIVRKNGSVELRRSDLSGKQQVKVTLTARDGRVLYSNPNYVFRDQYQISNELASFFEEQGPAIDRVSRDFSRTLVSNILEAF